MIKLIVSDLDGTLLKNHFELSDGFFELFEELDKRGINFVAASGRGYAVMKDFFDDIKDRMYIVSSNGALLFKNDVLLESFEVDKSLIKRAYEVSKEIKSAAFVFANDKKLYVPTNDKSILEVINHYNKNVVAVDSIDDVDEKIYQMGIFYETGEDEIFNFVEKELGDDLRAIRSGPQWIDILNPTTNKGAMIAKLQEDLGVGIDETVVFGDYDNDLAMIDRAKYSFAMANATENVKRRAKYSCKSNVENGVILKIKELLNL